ncbi:metal-transporting ATPase [Frankia sp. CcI49]|uniref:heavy metal translocating P-type ATPase n=1 Tax=unclassified Frankia TaxID=2632575 RepID=UPI0007C80CE5|nr:MULTISPECIES: heavy metal translocating P-type ATPase [unclassified Frankia]ONH59375.1 metal-transporting ATPase [Frankia sp. CcI49]
MRSLPEVRAAAAAAALFTLGLITHLAHGPEELWWALYLGCYVAGGAEPGVAGLRALRNRALDVDLLMVAAAIGAAAIGQVLDGALLIVIFAISGALEALATRHTEDSVRDLLDLAPEHGTRISAAGEEIVPAAALRVGDVILVRPGERIGGDGEVVAGASEVDQASITGEPLPADRRTGDRVFAGTVNGTGALHVRITHPAGDTLIARIVTMVQQASATKARTQLFIEKVEQRYSIGMVTATLALFAVPLMLGADLRPTLLRAMTFMIVASPCAVVLATMPPLLSAIATAGRHGVLVKSTVVLEHLATATHIAFDKTGTLTDGSPRLAHIHALGSIPEYVVLACAAAAENPSQHPLARAIVTAARDRGITPDTAEDFTSKPGRGVRARVNGQLVEIGSPAQTLPTADRLSLAGNLVAATENAGYTAVVVRIDGTPAAVLALADQTRPDAADTIARLTALTGNRPVLLTGDNPRAATRLAADLAISDVRAGLLPEDKVDAVRDLEATGDRVVVVGDGVNDAPALAAAHVGIAMGRAGSDLALDTADAVITRDELATLPALIALARRARRLVIANLVIAATFIAVLAAWDLLATLPLPLGVAGHEGSTIIVGLNGLRLLRSRTWAAPGRHPRSFLTTSRVLQPPAGMQRDATSTLSS